MFPAELGAQLAELGLLGMHIEGYGCAGRRRSDTASPSDRLEAGIGLRTFVSVQGSLAMTAIPEVRGPEDAVAPSDGRRRGDRLLRAHRTHRRIRPGPMTTLPAATA